MPTFAYKAVTAAGKTTSGSLDAPDRKQALRKLKTLALQPLHISVQVEGATAAPRESAPETVETVEQADAGKPSAWQQMLAPKGGPKLAHAFLTKLLQLHGSGMPLGEAVQLIANRVREPRLQQLAHDLYRDLTEGRTLATAMRRHPETFDAATPHLIEAGEATGNLKPILQNLIQHIEEREAIKKKIQAGLAYPLFIAGFAFVVGIFCIIYLIPKVQNMLRQIGGELNALSRFMIWLSEFTVAWGPFIGGGVVILVALLWQWRRSEQGRALTDQWLLAMPLASSIVRSANLSRLSNIMHILLSNGVNTTESLRLAENTLTNTRLRKQFFAARSLIQDGAPFSAAFRKYGIMRSTDLDILTVGENTGSLVQAFDEIAQLHTASLSSAFKTLTVGISVLAFVLAISLVATLILTVMLSVMQIQETLTMR